MLEPSLPDRYQLYHTLWIIKFAGGSRKPPGLGGTEGPSGERILPWRPTLDAVDQALEPQPGKEPLDRLLASIQHLPRPVAISLRNTFRHKARVTLTLAALALGAKRLRALA